MTIFRLTRGMTWVFVGRLARFASLFGACCFTALAASAATDVAFETARAIPLGAGAADLAVADFDGDGLVDLAASHSDPAISASIALNDGEGRFAPATSATGGYGFYSSIAAADFDEDGAVDVVRANDGHSTLTFLPGDGEGGLGIAATLTLPGSPYGLLAGDFTGDGHVDLVMTLPNRDTIALRAGFGTGGFAPAVESAAGDSPFRLATADFDGDGDLDVAVTSSSAGTVAILRNDGAGVFVLTTTLTATAGCDDIATDDFDGDGEADLVAIGTTHARVFLGDGAGGFSAVSPFSLGDALTAVVTGDFDRDGRVDIAAVDVESGTSLCRILVLAGNGAGDFAQGHTIRMGVALHSPLVAADLDEDGTLDLVAGLHIARNVALAFFGDVVTGFGRSRESDTFDTPRPPVVADFSEDGFPDLALLHLGRSGEVLLGDGSGGFLGQPAFFYGFAPRAILADDVSGDGHADVLVVDAGGEDFEEIFDSGLWAAFGDGSGGLDAGRLFSSLGDARCGVVVDVNGDAAPDVALGHFAGEKVTILLNDSTGAFSPGASFDVGRRVSSIAAGDFDEDGARDLVVGFDTASGSVTVLSVAFGDGVGGFAAPVDVEAGATEPRPADVVDLDGDGHEDIVVSGGGTRVIYGDGAGGFGAPMTLGPYVAGSSALVADVDEDGTLDLAVPAGGDTALFLGIGGREFEETERIFEATMAVGDFDADGHVDLVASDYFGKKVLFARNRTFDSLDSRRGNVNAGAGPAADVLRVNGSAGSGRERRVFVAPSDPFEIFVDRPPSKLSGTSRFALYLSLRKPSAATADALPLGLGRAALQTPLTGGDPHRTWNNIGRFSKLGVPDLPSSPAPNAVLSLASGLGRPACFYLQGLIVDLAAPNGQAAVTNGIEVVAE